MLQISMGRRGPLVDRGPIEGRVYQTVLVQRVKAQPRRDANSQSPNPSCGPRGELFGIESWSVL